VKAGELAAMARFFELVRSGADYAVAAEQVAASPEGRCTCQINRAGVWALAGTCLTATEATPRPAHCRTESHLALRIHMDQLKLPTAHLSDPQLDDALPRLVELVDDAPNLTLRRFVIELQERLGASLAPLAAQARQGAGS
jgi:hypothetical protein